MYFFGMLIKNIPTVQVYKDLSPQSQFSGTKLELQKEHFEKAGAM